MARQQDIEVHRVEAVRGSVCEPADVPRRDGLGHPLDEPAAIVGRANVAQTSQAGPRQPTKPWIADAEEPRPRGGFGRTDTLMNLGERYGCKVNHRASGEEIKASDHVVCPPDQNMHLSGPLPY